MNTKKTAKKPVKPSKPMPKPLPSRGGRMATNMAKKFA